LHEEKEHRTRGAVRFLGMWHTHPGGIAEPSGTDLGAMQKLRASAKRPPRNFLMLIVGGHSPDYEIQGYLFGR
jgi:proteasome lid subunit RPN8/RPN11